MKFTTVEISEGVYSTLWNAIVKTGDKDTLRLWYEVVHKEEYPVMHYKIAKDLFYGFLDDIQKYKVPIDVNMILHNSHVNGYHVKHYSKK